MDAHAPDEPAPLQRTFLFTDIEGSYRQWERHPDVMPAALAVHDAILHGAASAQGGRIFKTIGDAICAVFDQPLDGARAAVDAQRALHAVDWAVIGLAQPLTVRMALQTGDAVERDGDFSGLVLNRISRLLRAGHGGQVLLTGSIADAVECAGIAGVGLRDLGERRLRDVPGANRIYQLEIAGLPHAFPPLETLDAIAHNLPVALNTCLDREAELAEMRRLLLDSPARLVTLLGPGGIGKTRLALHAATQLIDAFPGGVWFVDLSGIRDAALMPTAVASVLGARSEPGADTQRALTEAIGERELLLLLDNCEQIVDGVARFIAGLLPNAPGVRILATSRVPLELRGEQRIDIGPLPIENNDDAGPAVQLFIERAQQIRPAFELTAANQASVYEICRRVDGIPLALELAAARVAVLSPEALRARLSSRLSLLTSTSRDLPERHQTLRGAIEWSYALLPPEEQTAFRALSVFQGGWSLAGAQAVTGLDELATMEVLGSLRDKSLVRLAETDDGEPRYSMLETIQEYGYGQLPANEAFGLASRHASFIVQLTAEASTYIEGGPLQRLWLGTLDTEIANIRAALQWSLDAKMAASMLEISMNCWYYWSQKGLATEGQSWFGRALTLASGIDPTLRAGALRRLGNLCVERGELRSAEQLYRASAEIEQHQKNQDGLASSLLNLGMVLGMMGNNTEDLACLQRSLDLHRELGDTRGVAMSLLNMAHRSRNAGATSAALATLQEVLELQLQIRDEIGVSFSHLLQARVYQDMGENELASELLFGAEQVFEDHGIEVGRYEVWLGRASLEHALRNDRLATDLIEQAISGYMTHADKAFLAHCYQLFAQISAAGGHVQRSAELLGQADYLRQLTGVVIPPIDRDESHRLHEALHLELGAVEFDLRWNLGRQHCTRMAWWDVMPIDLLTQLDQQPTSISVRF